MSGFFSRIFSIFSRKKNVDSDETTSFSNVEKLKEEAAQPSMRERPKSTKIPRTKETQAYVESIKKKAFSPENNAKPYVNNVDPKRIEELTKKIKEKF